MAEDSISGIQKLIDATDERELLERSGVEYVDADKLTQLLEAPLTIYHEKENPLARLLSITDRLRAMKITPVSDDRLQPDITATEENYCTVVGKWCAHSTTAGTDRVCKATGNAEISSHWERCPHESKKILAVSIYDKFWVEFSGKIKPGMPAQQAREIMLGMLSVYFPMEMVYPYQEKTNERKKNEAAAPVREDVRA